MKCALCRIGNAKEDGHLIPHFVFRHMVKTSPTGFLRAQQNPNRRLQDGASIKFLCPRCEDQFARWESIFAQTVFRPLHRHQVYRDGRYVDINGLCYGPWLSRFCTSVSWRSLYSLRLSAHDHPELIGDLARNESAFEAWREFLVGKRDRVESFPQHLIVTSAPSEMEGGQCPLDLMLHMERGVTNAVWFSRVEAYVFTKMCRAIVVGTIRDELRPWAGTLVRPEGGTFSSDIQVVSGLVGEWIRHDVEGMSRARGQVSPRQSRVIDTAVRRFLSKRGGGGSVEA
jgi:hypothetical protein